MILSLISQKGGVGKSTLARLMAVEMARAGWRVLIADLDAAQGTSTLWHHRRTSGAIEPDVAVMRFRSVERALQEAPRHDLTILDGPAHADRGGLTMAQASALVILPTGYSLDDLEPQARVAYELADAGVPADRIRLALCRTRGSDKEGQGVRTYLKRAGLTAFAHELRELPTIRQAHTLGRAASETAHAKINEEAQAVAREIAAAMMKGASNASV
jgi:chromosome partitioning protein